MSSFRVLTLGAIIAALVVAFCWWAGSAHATAPAPLLLGKSNDIALLQAQAAADGVTLPAFTWTGCGGKSDPLACQPGQVPIATSEGAVWEMAQDGYAGPVVVDIEVWSYTPAIERAHPVKWICRAAHLRRIDPALQVIITPYARKPADMITQDAAAAKCGAYAVDIQSQWSNAHPITEFKPFVTAAVRAIRKQSKTVIILAGLATNNPVPQTVAHLKADWFIALAAGVQGFWENNAAWSPTRCNAAEGGIGCPEIGVRLLQAVTGA